MIGERIGFNFSHGVAVVASGTRMLRCEGSDMYNGSEELKYSKECYEGRGTIEG